MYPQPHKHMAITCHLAKHGPQAGPECGLGWLSLGAPLKQKLPAVFHFSGCNPSSPPVASMTPFLVGVYP